MRGDSDPSSAVTWEEKNLLNRELELPILMSLQHQSTSDFLSTAYY
jgi:hypothetical protein